MASVSVVSGPVEADDSPVDVPEKDWGKLTTARSIFVGVRIPYDCRSLLKFVDQAEKFEMWKHTGHDSLEHYVRDGLGVDPQTVEWARLGLNQMGDSGAVVSLKEAAKLGSKDAVRKAISENPKASHRQIAEIVGLSQSYVTELIGEISEESERKLLNHGGKREKQVANSHSSKLSGKSSSSPERVIARLKRDQAKDPKAKEVLSRIEKGEVKPYRAAVEMGWVRPPDPAAIVEKQREKLEPQDQVRVWREWGRALPEGSVDRVQIAREAILNLTVAEQHELLTWANETLTG